MKAKIYPQPPKGGRLDTVNQEVPLGGFRGDLQEKPFGVVLEFGNQ